MFNIPYIFFGEIPILMPNDTNKLEYVMFYRYVIYTNHIGNNVHILQIKLNRTDIEEITQFDDNNSDLIEKLQLLHDELKKTPTKYKRIQKFLEKTISSKMSALGQGNGNEHSTNYEQENQLQQSQDNINNRVNNNNYIKYPADYQFSGKKNGKAYNTNKSFRGNKLYLYDPIKEKYELLLTELDYLVNINGENVEPAITYSGVLDNKLTNAGNTKIPITDIDYYLYCPNRANLPIKPIYIQKLWPNTTTYHNVDIDGSIEFPCWIIFKKYQS